MKVGSNLRRKVVLLAIWALSPLMLYVHPTLFGIFDPHADLAGFLHNMSLLMDRYRRRRCYFGRYICSF